jgi:Zn-dependent protease with chaperone function
MRSHELSMNPPYYPPSPEPAGCFRPSAAYHVLLCGVTASLAFALMVYVTLLVCFSAGFVVLLLAGTPLQQLLLTLPLALAVLWLGANLFPVRHAECDTGEELQPEEHRLLFDFIGSLCNELGIAPPRRVFITDNNNADALLRYHALAIGRPLVNELNVSEFKALLAHELAHFRQVGVRRLLSLGRGFDILELAASGDNHLDRLFRMGKQGRWLRWLPSSVCWTLRLPFRVLSACVLLQMRALRRHAELHADGVAIRLAGTPAVLRLLAHLELDDDRATIWATHPDRGRRKLQAHRLSISGPVDRRPARLLFAADNRGLVSTRAPS